MSRGVANRRKSSVFQSLGQPPVRWQSGDAADCKSANVGSIPARTSNLLRTVLVLSLGVQGSGAIRLRVLLSAFSPLFKTALS